MIEGLSKPLQTSTADDLSPGITGLKALPIRERLRQFIEAPRTQNALIALILLNAVILGMETSAEIMDRAGAVLKTLDKLILTAFVIEIGIRLFVHRMAFWKDPWSVFDFLVVAIALIPASGPFAILRALRVLRVLRLLTLVPAMRKVVGALLGALPGLGSIILVLAVLYYVFGVMATMLFAEAYPEWFGTLGRSFYTLFQIMTLESWSMGVARPVMETFPYAWLFFIPFILVATFTMLNLFIAIIVNAMETYRDEHEPLRPRAPEQAQNEQELRAEISTLSAEIRELKELLRKPKQPNS